MKNSCHKYLKMILPVVCIISFSNAIIAQNTLTIYQKDGQQFSYGFDEKPVIKYTEDDLILKTTNTEVIFPLTAIAKFNFNDNERNNVKKRGGNVVKSKIQNNNEKLTTAIQGQIVSLKGGEPESTIMVIGVDGKIWKQYKADVYGSASFSISDLRTGVYIIKTEKQVCKILKR